MLKTGEPHHSVYTRPHNLLSTGLDPQNREKLRIKYHTHRGSKHSCRHQLNNAKARPSKLHYRPLPYGKRKNPTLYREAEDSRTCHAQHNTQHFVAREIMTAAAPSLTYMYALHDLIDMGCFAAGCSHKPCLKKKSLPGEESLLVGCEIFLRTRAHKSDKNTVLMLDCSTFRYDRL